MLLLVVLASGANDFLEGAKASAKGGIDLVKQTQTKAYSPEFLTDTPFADLDTLGFDKVKKVGVETKDVAFNS